MCYTPGAEERMILYHSSVNDKGHISNRGKSLKKELPSAVEVLYLLVEDKTVQIVSIY